MRSFKKCFHKLFFSVTEQANYGLDRLTVEASRSRKISHTHKLGYLWSIQLFVEAAIYITHKVSKGKTTKPSTGLEPGFPTIRWLQT